MRDSDLRQRTDAAFTLIEILVVITIISILASLTLVGVLKAKKSGLESAAKAELQTICARIENFRNSWGYFPPSSFAFLKVKGNGVNDGNETLFSYLLSRKKGGPFADDLKEDRWVNADADELSQKDLKTVTDALDWVRGTAQLLEYTDFWNNPFVYIPATDYGKKSTYQNIDGDTFEVEAAKNPTTGTYCAPTTYQLWSLGADGVNQNGGGDDIVSWK